MYQISENWAHQTDYFYQGQTNERANKHTNRQTD